MVTENILNEYLKKVRDCVWEISTDYKKGMRVPGRVYLDDEAIKTVETGALDRGG